MDEDTNTPATQDLPITQDNSGTAQVIINLESMIKTHIGALDKLNEEIRKHKEMLDDIFANDPTYQEHLKQAEEVNKVKNGTKLQILKRPQAHELDQKIKGLKADLKENQASLSDYLGEYQRLSGVNEIEGEDGEMREIIYTAKLIKKSSKFV